MQRRTIAALTAGVVAIAALVGWWTLRSPTAAAVTVAVAPLVRTLQFSARVATASRVDVGSTITGRVLEVAVVEGAQVHQGQLLVRLESEELRAALGQAQASERQAVARLAGLRGTGRTSARAALSQTESVLAAAKADLQRTEALVAQGFLSPARLDEVRRAFAVAEAQQAGARSQYAATVDEGTDIAQAQSQLALATSATAAARARLEQTVITAPTDARVLARLVEPGQIVQPGRALLTLALSSPPQLVAQADERFLAQLRVGQPASVVADAYPGQPFAARVLSIAPLVDAQRGAVEVKFSLPQGPPPFLREDMTLSVEVETAHRDAALVVPASALRGATAGADATVLVDRDGRVEQRAVRVGLRTLDAAEVVEGLSAGDTVLLGPAPAPGSRVRAEVQPLQFRRASGARRTVEDAGSAMTNAMGR